MDISILKGMEMPSHIRLVYRMGISILKGMEMRSHILLFGDKRLNAQFELK